MRIHFINVLAMVVRRPEWILAGQVGQGEGANPPFGFSRARLPRP